MCHRIAGFALLAVSSLLLAGPAASEPAPTAAITAVEQQEQALARYDAREGFVPLERDSLDPASGTAALAARIVQRNSLAIDQLASMAIRCSVEAALTQYQFETARLVPGDPDELAPYIFAWPAGRLGTDPAKGLGVGIEGDALMIQLDPATSQDWMPASEYRGPSLGRHCIGEDARRATSYDQFHLLLHQAVLNLQAFPTDMDEALFGSGLELINLEIADPADADIVIGFDGVQAFRFTVRFPSGAVLDTVDYWKIIGTANSLMTTYKYPQFAREVGRSFTTWGAYNLVPADQAIFPAVGISRETAL